VKAVIQATDRLVVFPFARLELEGRPANRHRGMRLSGLCRPGARLAI
jgi:hypothetical protein